MNSLKMFFLRLCHKLHIRHIDIEMIKCLHIITMLGQNNSLIIQNYLNQAKDLLYKVRIELDRMREEMKHDSSKF